MSIKQRLFDHCQQYVEQCIANIQLALEEVRRAANEETKSSVGDKYETSRAMMQLEQEKLAVQLSEAQQLQHVLNKIKCDNIAPIINEGSVVVTNQGNYFIAISAGKIQLEGKLYYAISAQSPIGAALLGKQINDEYAFRGQSFRVLDVS